MNKVSALTAPSLHLPIRFTAHSPKPVTIAHRAQSVLRTAGVFFASRAAVSSPSQQSLDSLGFIASSPR